MLSCPIKSASREISLNLLKKFLANLCRKWGAPHLRHYVEPGKMVSDEGNYRISANSF